MEFQDRVRRVFIVTTVLTIVVVAVVFLTSFSVISQTQRDLAVASLKEALLEEVENKTTTLLETLASNLYDPLYYVNFDEIRRLLQQTARDADTRYIYLVDANWALVHDGNEPKIGVPMQTLGVEPPLSNETSVRYDDHVQFFVPVQNDVGIQGYVVADVSLGALDTYQQEIIAQFEKSKGQSQLILLGLMVLLVAVIVASAVVLSRTLKKHFLLPVLRLKSSAEKVGAGELDEVINVAGDAEIVSLSNAFDDMRHQLKQSINKERQMAYFDSVTELPNRFAFQTRLDELVKKQQDFSILFFDLDDFKQVNDTLGHSVGDGLLSAFGNRTLNRLKVEHEFEFPLYRLGGDEFVLIIEKQIPKKTLQAVGETCIDVVKSPFMVASNACRVGVSIGAACFPEHGNNAELILQYADVAMYQAKNAGKNQLSIYEPVVAKPAAG